MIWYEVSAGMCLSSCLCHFALGAKRPIRSVYLVFAAMMVVIAAFQLCLAGLSAATTQASAVAFSRWAVVLVCVFMPFFGVFVCRYAGVTVPRPVAWVFFASYGAFLIYDLVAPEGLVPVTPGIPTRVPLQALHVVWQAMNAATATFGVVAGWRMARRGPRPQGAVLAIGSLAFAVTAFIDLIRNLLQRDWLYLGGFGVIALALVLSAQLAADCRRNELRLAEMLLDSLRLRDQINTPLQTLVFGLEIAEARGTLDRDRLFALRRAVDRLVELGNRLR